MITYTFSIYKNDKRTKTGCRFIKDVVHQAPDEASVITEINMFLDKINAEYPIKNHQVEYRPSMKMVKNLMTGLMISIPYDTPRSCDPSSELYWSM